MVFLGNIREGLGSRTLKRKALIISCNFLETSEDDRIEVGYRLIEPYFNCGFFQRPMRHSYR